MPDRPDWHESWPEVPEGYEVVAIIDPMWRLDEKHRCRYGASRGHKACGRPSVAALRRGNWQPPVWWAYCADHLYGRWIEDGKVMHWILRKKPGA